MNKLQNANCNSCFNRKSCPYNHGNEVCSFYRSGSSVIDVKDGNFGTILICAVRYAIGRRSYMPHLVQDFIRPLLPELSNGTLTTMQRDILPEAIYSEEYWGDPQIDKPGWMVFLKDIETELESRK